MCPPPRPIRVRGHPEPFIPVKGDSQGPAGALVVAPLGGKQCRFFAAQPTTTSVTPARGDARSAAPGHGAAADGAPSPPAAKRPSAITRKVKEGTRAPELISSRNGAAAAFAGVALKMLDSPLRLRGADLEGSTPKRRAG